MGFTQRTTFRMITNLVLVGFLLLGGLKERGWALTSEVPLQLEEDRLTGRLSQVTLRTVLEQLQEQLGLTYEAPVAELDKIISIDLQQVPILPALAQILAPWDYAFTVNSAGHLKFLYVTPKAPPAEIISETKSSDAHTSDPVAETEFNPLNSSNPIPETGDANLSLANEYEGGTGSTSSSPLTSSPEEDQDFSAPVTGVPMAIQPVPEGTIMPMVPSNGSGMKISPAANPPDMAIIPANAYPPMEIQPVPEYLKEEMLQNFQP